MAKQQGHLLHRVAHLILSPDTECRKQFDAFIAHGERLELFPITFVTLRRYAMIPLCERAIEALHAQLKKSVCNATYALPPFICSKMREARHLDKLRNGAGFYEFVKSNWMRRGLMDKVLALRYPSGDLQLKSYSSKVGLVYQCSVASEFECLAAKTVIHSTFVASIADQMACPINAQQTTQTVTDYLRSLFTQDTFFSMPSAMYAAATTPFGATAEDNNPVQKLLDASDLEEEEFPFQDSNNHVFFVVVNPNLGNRHNVSLPHVADDSAFSITVVRCRCIGVKTPLRQVVLYRDTDGLDKMSLLWLASNIHNAPRSTYAWAATKQHSVRVERPSCSAAPNSD